MIIVQKVCQALAWTDHGSLSNMTCKSRTAITCCLAIPDRYWIQPKGTGTLVEFLSCSLPTWVNDAHDASVDRANLDHILDGRLFKQNEPCTVRASGSGVAKI